MGRGTGSFGAAEEAMRPSAGRARSRWSTIVLGAALTWAAGGAAGTSAGASQFPISSVGDIWFQADHAGFRGDDGEVVEEYYFRITDNQLQFNEEEDGSFSGQAFIRLRFKDEDGDEATAGSPDHAQVLLLREPLDPRARTVEVQIEDLNARKRGLLYLVTGKRRNGAGEAELDPPPFVGKDFGISDVQFAWHVEEAGADSSFEKNGLNVVPNPSRGYGLLQDRLTAYYEIYDLRPDVSGERTYVAKYEILGPGGPILAPAPDTVLSSSGECVRVVSFDLSQVKSGELRLRATVTNPATGEESVSERPFSVLWESGSWNRTEQDVLDEARVLFTEDEYEKFKAMSAGDRELYVQRFWSDEDPTPDTEVNELRAEFLRRVDFANRQFSAHGVKGMITDRGRIYIRFGEPDEVERELMPTVDHQLDRQVDDLAKENAEGKLLATNDETDTRPYEIWTYTRQGEPLFPNREFSTSVTGLKFVFVDETGTGKYVLRYSSNFIGY
jgi:GWxTD domain-containing protein